MMDVRSILDSIGALPDAEIDLADAAIQLARIDAPDADWREAQLHLSEIAHNIARSANEPAEEYESGDDSLQGRAATLASLLWDHYNYTGDSETYDNLANANLLRVIERRRGLPVALGILWLHAATAAGWHAYGVDLPGHFVVALAAEGEPPLALDPFDAGKALSERALERLVRRYSGDASQATLPPMSNRAVLIRLQNNIRLRRIQAGDLTGALVCAEDTLRFAPEEPGPWREVGMLQERLGRVTAALVSYERSLDFCPPGASATRMRAAIKALRMRLN